MSTNKNALIRYKVLDQCFRNPGRRYFIDDLIEECDKVLLEIDPNSNGISRRQIFEDIAFMESKEGWSIELKRQRFKKKVYYQYTNTAFSINNMPLNELEITQLKSAISILTQFTGMPQFDWINEMVPKIQQRIAIDSTTEPIMDFDNNRYLKGIDRLGALYSGVFYKKVLLVKYKPFENDVPYDVLIHPYFLKQYNNRWFLFGYNPESGKSDWNLAIDRILEVTETTERYIPNSTINWNFYFEDIIGVTKPSDEKIEKVELVFFGRTAKYIETKPLHGSQKMQWINSDSLEVKLELMINYEFERMLMSYADSLKVIKPQSLARSVLNKLKAGIQNNAES
jgi:predicted DNA-binding transcriptional regulator YafY